MVGKILVLLLTTALLADNSHPDLLGGSYDEVRVRDQSQNRKTDWTDDSTECLNESGGQSNHMAYFRQASENKNFACPASWPIIRFGIS